MTFTFLLAVLSASNPKLGAFFKSPATLILSFIMMISCVCYISMSKSARQKVPMNYCLLAGATLGEACFLAAVAADLTVFSVYTAIMATCLAVGGLFAAAMYTASTVDRETLIRNMVYGMMVSLCIDLIMLFVILILWNPKDKAVVATQDMVVVLLLLSPQGFIS